MPPSGTPTATATSTGRPTDTATPVSSIDNPLTTNTQTPIPHIPSKDKGKYTDNDSILSVIIYPAIHTNGTTYKDRNRILRILQDLGASGV